MPNLKYKIEIKASAARTLEKMPIGMQNKLRKIIASLGITPRPVGMKKLKAHPNLLRLRVGDYRIIYHIMDDKLVVLVVAVGVLSGRGDGENRMSQQCGTRSAVGSHDLWGRVRMQKKHTGTGTQPRADSVARIQ